jgi:hypothetical protein
LLHSVHSPSLPLSALPLSGSPFILALLMDFLMWTKVVVWWGWICLLWRGAHWERLDFIIGRFCTLDPRIWLTCSRWLLKLVLGAICRGWCFLFAFLMFATGPTV